MVATQERNRITPGVGAALGAFALFLLLTLAAQLFWQRREGLDRDVATRVEDDARMETFAAFCERRAVSRAASFEKAEAAVFAGNLTLDLTEAGLAPSGGSVEAAVFGGKLQVRVPEDWTVVRGEQVILGGFVNHTRRAQADPAKILRLEGLVVGGAIVVTH
jgi:predicted membrane protein